MHKAGRPDTALCRAVIEMAAGRIDADLGGYVVTKRITLPGQGKRGGTRTLVATRLTVPWVFLYGFARTSGSRSAMMN